VLAAAVAAAAVHQSLFAANPTEALEAPAVEVIGTTPLPGLATPIRDVPANVQVFGARELTQQRQTNVGEYLEANPTSVTLNSVQGNPFQADVNFRGFTASPVLGTPQGLSVFVDGVRVNEPFGDVVNWDLIPQAAIASIQLIPGSNPTFGLNTLGGALAVYTKSGSQSPGGSLEAYGGSFGRKATEAQFGGKKGNVDWFMAANFLDDQGWAQHNPSTVQQLFGKTGWQDDKTDLDVSLTLVDNRLQGTQTLPLSMFDNIRQAYTFPDRTDNRLAFLTAKGSRFINDNVIVGGNLYYRKYRNENFNSNVNGDFKAAPDPEATNDLAAIDQDSYGGGAQLTRIGKLGAMDNQFVLGASGDFGRAHFTQDSQDAIFTADRGTLATSPFARVTDAQTSNRYWGLYFSDTLKLDAAWTLTLSGRYNRAWVKVEDRSGLDPQLDGEHSFSRFNPAVGLNYSPGEQLTAYAAYNEGMRAPTPIELACADQNAPCKLPNNFIADPDLKKVVSKTAEFGLRGKLAHETSWSAAIYRTELTDDIQFISANSGAANAGFFENVGKTRRQGLELSLATRQGALSGSVRYSYVDATFQSPFSVHSPSNSSADPASGDIQVQPGDRIPGIPQHSLKLRLQYDWGEQASLGANLVVSSHVFARGDENNRDINGSIPGYAAVNIDGRRAIGKGCELFVRVANLFDRRYANFGLLGQNWFNTPDRTFNTAATPANEQFRGPGAPRGAWIGIRYQWL